MKKRQVENPNHHLRMTPPSSMKQFSENLNLRNGFAACVRNREEKTGAVFKAMIGPAGIGLLCS